MKITSTALSLNVADTDASADFAKTISVSPSHGR